jgi:hypothetical protein
MISSGIEPSTFWPQPSTLTYALLLLISEVLLDNSVCTESGLWTRCPKNWVSISCWDKRDFILLQHLNTIWRPDNLVPNGSLVIFSSEAKWPVHKINHSLPSSAEIKNTWSYISTPPPHMFSRHDTLVIKHSDNFESVTSGSKGAEFVSKTIPCNRPWKPIGLWDVKDPTLSRQSAHS